MSAAGKLCGVIHNVSISNKNFSLRRMRLLSYQMCILNVEANCAGFLIFNFDNLLNVSIT